MTDMPDNRAIRNLHAAQPRSLLFAALTSPLDMAETLWKLMTRDARLPMPTNARSRAERALLAERLRDESRRKVDRLMM